MLLREKTVVEEEGLVLVKGHGGAGCVVKDLEGCRGKVVDGSAVLEHGREMGEAGAVGGHEAGRGGVGGLEDFSVEEDAEGGGCAGGELGWGVGHCSSVLEVWGWSMRAITDVAGVAYMLGRPQV